MARLKKDLHKYVEIREEDYLQLVENTMIVEAMKLAGVEKLPLWKAVRRILDDRRIEIHVKPVNRRYADWPQKLVPFKKEPVYKTSKALENNVFSWAFIVHVSRNEFDTPFTFVGKWNPIQKSDN